MKQEKLDWLADNPFYSKRFAFFVGRRCRAMTIKDVAQETHLDWKTIKELDKQYKYASNYNTQRLAMWLTEHSHPDEAYLTQHPDMMLADKKLERAKVIVPVIETYPA